MAEECNNYDKLNMRTTYVARTWVWHVGYSYTSMCLTWHKQ